MVDLPTVCCMCGDVGFSDKLFLCRKCGHRFQHSYCSNYYNELTTTELCDWCHREERNSRHGGGEGAAKRSAGTHLEDGIPRPTRRSEYSSGDKIKRKERDQLEAAEKGNYKKSSGNPSSRPTTRRYKLLKDVMC